jgi:hypothetical protein
VSGGDLVNDLDRWIFDLETAPEEARRGTRPVVQKGLLNIKKDWQARWRGLSNAPDLPSAISYDTKETPLGAVGEVGPDVEKPQGYLGNLIEFGSVNNPPHPGGLPAAEKEEPRFLRAMEDLGFRAVEK